MASNVSEPELSVLDEILAVESGGLMSKSDGTSDGGGHQQKEVFC